MTDGFDWLQTAKQARGWDNNAYNDPDPKQQQADQFDALMEEWQQANIFYQTFAEGPGALALELIREMTIEKPSFWPGTINDGTNLAAMPAAEQGFVREGQNSMYRFFVQQMKRAQEGPPEAPSEQTQTEE